MPSSGGFGWVRRLARPQKRLQGDELLLEPEEGLAVVAGDGGRR